MILIKIIVLKKKNIRTKIKKIINNQFTSDVPVALSLSGGVDSNLLREMLAENRNFSSYSVFFETKKSKDYFNNDFYFAKKISNETNINFHEVSCNYKDFEDSIEEVNKILEEPSGNPNSIINHILSKNISEKVLFTGDGGDEIFGGYDRYKSMYVISLLKKLNIHHLFFFNKSKNFERLRFKNSNEFFLSFGEQNIFKDVQNYYLNFYKIDEVSVKKHFNFSNSYNSPRLNNLMFRDLETWVVNDICLRNDKIYSNKGIEARVPFLDKEIINNFLMYPEYKNMDYVLKIKKY